jgi:hypothetical protein
VIAAVGIQVAAAQANGEGSSAREETSLLLIAFVIESMVS